MKKIISLVLVFTLIISYAAFAETISAFENAYNQDIKYVDIKAEIKTNITKMSDAAKEYLKSINKDVENTKKVYSISLETTDFIKNRLSVISEQTIPNVSEPYRLEQYYDIDLSYKRPLYAVILKYPDVDGYVLYNMIEVAELQPFVYNLKNYLNNVNGISFDKRGEVKKGVYTLKLNDSEAKESIIGFLNSASPIAAATLRYYGRDLGKDYTEIYSAMKNVKLFSDDALTLKATLDSKGNPDKIDITLKLDTNLYELYSELSKTYVDVSPDGLTKANSQVKSTISISIDFENVNSADKMVLFPQINQDNTYSYTGDMLQDYFGRTFKNNKINIYANSKLIEFTDAEPIIENNRTLVPIRKFLNSIGVKDEDIAYDNGYITINYYNEKIVKLNVFDTNASVTENGVTKDIALDVSAKMVNDRTLVPLRFLGETFNCDVVFQEMSPTTVFINVVQLD